MVRHVPPGKADARRTGRATASPQPSFRMTGCHVIIIGAGIGGLAATLSLQRHGLRVSVYEQAPELREFGAGLMVTPNAMHALDFLGVGGVIAATSNVSAGLLIKHYRTGEVLEHRSHGDAYRLKYGAGNFQVHRADLVMNIVANARQPRWEAEGWAIRAEVSELLELYGDFHPQVLRMIESIEPDGLFKWGLRDREPLSQWTIGRVSTLGDAAHPMSPFLGQGAVMAIEDGMVLGRCFAKASTAEEALALYERARRQRANAVQLESREQANALQGSHLEHFNPGRNAEERGLFDYNPATVPI
jgi:2-polyprenyl-6-methoxyphenol hydroxylase-like FAD-dependent oxidoreductase